MRAGDLNERITIQQNTPTQDAFGAEVASWSTVATVWAQVIAQSGSEQIAAGVGVATTIYTVTIRYRDDVTTQMRILYEGLTLEIRAVLSGDDAASMKLDCRQVER